MQKATQTSEDALSSMFEGIGLGSKDNWALFLCQRDMETDESTATSREAIPRISLPVPSL